MRTRHSLAILMLCALPSLAVERLGAPAAPSLWDAFLPEPVHPSYASDLGALQEGRLGFGFQDGDLAHMSLSVPGLQIISSATRWDNEGASDRFAYDPGHASMVLDEWGNPVLRHREQFQVSGGLRLSNFTHAFSGFDLGLGLTYNNLTVTDEDERKMWSSSRLISSATLQYGSLSLSGAWDPKEQKYRVGYRKPNDIQGGFEFYQNLEEDQCYGTQLGGEKIFRETVKFRMGVRWQWAEGVRIEQFLLVGTGIRFRPWRESVDPEWMKPFVAPMGGFPMVQRFLYDWEFAIDMMVDKQYNEANVLLSLNRWF